MAFSAALLLCFKEYLFSLQCYDYSMEKILCGNPLSSVYVHLIGCTVWAILGGVCYAVGGGLFCCADILPSYRPADAPYPTEWVRVMGVLATICILLGIAFFIWYHSGRKKQ